MSDLYILIGTGVLSSSLALDLRAVVWKNTSPCQIIGFDISQKNLSYAKKQKIIDDMVFDTNPEKAYSLLKKNYLTPQAFQKNKTQKAIIIIAAPVRAFEGIFKHLAALQLAPEIRQKLTITDVGSTKETIVQAATSLGDLQVCFVPAHPIAGSEKSGPEASRQGIFQNKYCFLTPLVFQSPPDTMINQQHIEKVLRMWQGIGAKIVEKTSQTHDILFSALSHTPHFLAFAAAHVYQKLGINLIENTNDTLKVFLRIAASDPTMWRDIACDNQKNILQHLQNFKVQMLLLKQQIQSPQSTNHQLNRVPLTIKTLTQSHRFHTKMGTQKANHTYKALALGEGNPQRELLFLPLAVAHCYLQSIVKQMHLAATPQVDEIFKIKEDDLQYAGTGLHDFSAALKTYATHENEIYRWYSFLIQMGQGQHGLKYLNAFIEELEVMEKLITDSNNQQAEIFKYIEAVKKIS